MFSGFKLTLTVSAGVSALAPPRGHRKTASFTLQKCNFKGVQLPGCGLEVSHPAWTSPYAGYCRRPVLFRSPFGCRAWCATGSG